MEGASRRFNLEELGRSAGFTTLLKRSSVSSESGRGERRLAPRFGEIAGQDDYPERLSSPVDAAAKTAN